MGTVAFDVADFQRKFPEFATQSPVNLAGYWDLASEYISPTEGSVYQGATLANALNLMTAHLAKLTAMSIAGQTPSVVSGGTEGSVSVSLVPPPVKSGWQWWLSTTAYGQQLWALMQIKSAAGLYVGGSLERASFRKAGGVF